MSCRAFESWEKTAADAYTYIESGWYILCMCRLLDATHIKRWYDKFHKPQKFITKQLWIIIFIIHFKLNLIYGYLIVFSGSSSWGDIELWWLWRYIGVHPLVVVVFFCFFVFDEWCLYFDINSYVTESVLFVKHLI